MRGAPRAPAWAVAASTAVALGVGFSVLLISVSQGVRDRIQGRLTGAAALPGLDVGTIDTILDILTYVVIAAMLLQTAAAVFILGVTTMRSRREEIALRRQSGVLRSRLLGEFTRSMFGACIVGGVIGEAAGVGAAAVLSNSTPLPVDYSFVALLSPFPATVLLALAATLWPAWRAASASPALLRKG